MDKFGGRGQASYRECWLPSTAAKLAVWRCAPLGPLFHRDVISGII